MGPSLAVFIFSGPHPKVTDLDPDPIAAETAAPRSLRRLHPPNIFARRPRALASVPMLHFCVSLNPVLYSRVIGEISRQFKSFQVCPRAR